MTTDPPSDWDDITEITAVETPHQLAQPGLKRRSSDNMPAVSREQIAEELKRQHDEEK